MRLNLRAQLLLWLMAPLALLATFNVYRDYANAQRTAGVVTDRLLLAAARELGEQVREEDGRIQALIPPSALGIFASVGRDRALYQIRNDTGELIAGYPDVAPPPEPPTGDAPVFYSGTFRGQDVRSAALAPEVVTKGGAKRVLVIVGETLREQDRVVSELWRYSGIEQGLMVLVAGALALFGLSRGLRPLLALRDHVRERDPAAPALFGPDAVQSELRPVVEALNEAAARAAAQVRAQRRFIDDAAHQMRTRLALLKTQASVGRRGADEAAKDEALAALDGSLDGLARLANQLLALARSEPSGAAAKFERLDLGAIARAALAARAIPALDRGVELGLDDQGAAVMGDATFLAELVANLVDNAIAYVGKGGRVVVSARTAEARPTLTVEDDGPGIPAAEREKVFERFYRTSGASGPGSGLGLAIVRQVAAAHRAGVALSEGSEGRGLRVTVSFPAPDG